MKFKFFFFVCTKKHWLLLHAMYVQVKAVLQEQVINKGKGKAHVFISTGCSIFVVLSVYA